MARLRASLAVLGIALGLGGSGCARPDGWGRVEGELALDGCIAQEPRRFGPYGFDAEYLATERYAGVLLIYLQAHGAEIEETDGLTIRLDLARLAAEGRLLVDDGRGLIVRSDESKPLVVRTSTAPEDANVSLSLFSTCPGFPTAYARAGTLALDVLRLAADPKDTGDGERLGGTLTSTLGRASSRGPVGVIRASFDFSPPARPLTDFR